MTRPERNWLLVEPVSEDIFRIWPRAPWAMRNISRLIDGTMRLELSFVRRAMIGTLRTMESLSNDRLTKPEPGACCSFGTGDSRLSALNKASSLSPITDTEAGR